MGLAGTWMIILGLFGSIVWLASASPQFLDAEDDAFLYNENLSSFSSSSTTIRKDGHTLMYGTGDNNKINYNGHKILVDHGSITLLEGDKTYKFQTLGPKEEKEKSINIDGRPVKVKFSKGNVFVYLSDELVMAKVGNGYFVGDSYAVEHRDQMIRSLHK